MTEARQKAWTKGPWRHDHTNHQIRTGVATGKRRFEGECIGSVSTLCPEMKANGNLIAAAPEMYGELFRALAALRVPQAFDLEGVTADIERVLAKARGER